MGDPAVAAVVRFDFPHRGSGAQHYPEPHSHPVRERFDMAREDTMNDIGDRIAAGIQRGLEASQPKRRIKPGSSEFDPKSPFRSKNGPRLRGNYYLNGIWENEDQCTDEEIRLMNLLSRPGRYINRRVEIRINDDAGQRTVFIAFADRTPDQRMENKDYWRNKRELLEKVIEEQGAVVPA